MIGTIAIAGGGTGGHIFPGIAIAEEFVRRKGGWGVVFIGTGKQLEKKIVTKRGFDLRVVPSSPLKGGGWGMKAMSIVTLIWGIAWALALLRRISPRVVIGLGGYSSGAVLVAAYLLRIPRVIQEQNAYPGLANRVASRFCQRVFISWDEGKRFFPPVKVRIVGNPLRKEVLLGMGKRRGGTGFTLLILGGSQGALTINTMMLETLPYLEQIRGDLKIVHQTGEGDYARVKNGYVGKGFQSSTYPFIEEMARYYRKAQLVICRAGATTMAELCAWGRASILLPYPHAADDHQRKNAQVMAKNGASRMIIEDELTGERLAQEILSLYHDRVRLHEMEAHAASLGRPEAATLIVDECYRLMGLI